MFILIFICLIAVAINSSDELLGILTVVVGWQHWQAQKLKQRLEFLELFQLRELSTRIKALELELDQRRANLEPEAQRYRSLRCRSRSSVTYVKRWARLNCLRLSKGVIKIAS